MKVVGVDLGGTKIKAGLLDGDGTIQATVSAATPRGSEAILQTVAELVRAHQAKSEGKAIGAVGVGTAGRVDPIKGNIVAAGDTIPGWAGTEVKEVLEGELSLPVFVTNDVNAAALGDGWLGAGRARTQYAYITIGTGLGGALVNGGKVIPGITGGAGEFGHTILYPNGIPCGCGQRGCVEKYVSGTALNRLAAEADPTWDSYELLAQYREGNKKALEVVQKFVTDLSVVLINVQNMFDPEIVILGGGVIDSYEEWKDLLGQTLCEAANITVHVAASPLGNEAGMIGAARLALDGIASSD